MLVRGCEVWLRGMTRQSFFFCYCLHVVTNPLTMLTVFVTSDVHLTQPDVEPHLCHVHDFDGSQLSSFDMTSLRRH